MWYLWWYLRCSDVSKFHQDFLTWLYSVDEVRRCNFISDLFCCMGWKSQPVTCKYLFGTHVQLCSNLIGMSVNTTSSVIYVHFVQTLFFACCYQAKITNFHQTIKWEEYVWRLKRVQKVVCHWRLRCAILFFLVKNISISINHQKGPVYSHTDGPMLMWEDLDINFNEWDDTWV